jgi:hypothetical protein
MTNAYNQEKMVERLLAEAELCERIAAASCDEIEANKFKGYAKNCRDAAICKASWVFRIAP